MFECATLFHLKFEGANPFVNGNGQTGHSGSESDASGFSLINIKYHDCRCYHESFDTYYCDNHPSSIIEIVTDFLAGSLDPIFEVDGVALSACIKVDTSWLNQLMINLWIDSEYLTN